jgi:hypothetical protein
MPLIGDDTYRASINNQLYFCQLQLQDILARIISSTDGLPESVGSRTLKRDYKAKYSDPANSDEKQMQ